MTLNELAYDIMSNVEGTSRISDDSELSIDQVYFKIHTTRSMLIRQDQAKGRSLSDNVMQTLPCLDVIEVDASECCGITSPCELYRTALRLPRAIETYQKDLIVRVSGVDITGPSWNYLSLAHLPWAGISKWTKDSTKWFTKGGYVYILNPPPVTKISVTGVFEDPTDLAQYPSCSGTPCFSNDNDEYPLSSYMVPTLKQLVLEDLMRMRSAPADDKGNEDAKVQNKIDQ
jgi:hypothetical protein